MKKNYALVSVTSFLMTTVLPNIQALGQQTSDRQTNPLIDKQGCFIPSKAHNVKG